MKQTKNAWSLDRADQDGRMQTIAMSVDEARALIDELSPKLLVEALDEAQGADRKPQYVILQIGG